MSDSRYLRVNPNPRLVWLVNYAIDEVNSRLHSRDEYSDWRSWAAAWKAGERSPGRCVDVAHRCFDHKNNAVWHTLGQLAWSAKESCYDAPQSGWLVIGYIADAMIAFGVAFPNDPQKLLGPQLNLIDGEITCQNTQLPKPCPV